MSGGLALQSDPTPIVACTVSRDVENFDLLIEDMETELGDAWGDLSISQAQAFLSQPEGESLELIAIAVDQKDESDIGTVSEIIRLAKQNGTRVILIADGLSPAGLHQLLKLGADDFVPYPLPTNALHEAITRVRALNEAPEPTYAPAAGRTGTDIARQTLGGVKAVFAVQSLAGGTGATTLAVNLAWELANIDKKNPPSVCLIDLDLQFGTVATYLDLSRREMILEMLTDAQSMDEDAFKQAIVTYGNKLSVFTAPSEILPLDMISPEDVTAILRLARESHDIVVIDMPSTIVQWTETILSEVDVYFSVLELDMRSAQNAMRFIKALKSEDLPLEKVNFVLNRAPGMTDMGGKSRAKRLSESLGVKIATNLSDGGKQIKQSCDHGSPLLEMGKKNALRKDILKLATGLHSAMLDDTKTG
ncbi:AAA family ATPase [Rhodophyticola sp. SM2404]